MNRGRIFMNEEIKFDYFRWLVDWVGGVEYLTLLRHLHRRPFHWVIDNDINREEDGRALRTRFIYETNYTEIDYPEDDCSVFEFLVGVANRMSDAVIDIEEDDRTRDCFWEIIDNLDLEKFSGEDIFNVGGMKAVDKIIDRLLDRAYGRNGDGGMFPLDYTKKDQRKVEIWYQMSAYLEQNYSID